MNQLSTGVPSTLGNYREHLAEVWGENSRAVVFLDDKIKQSPNGANEEVIADETQMVSLLMTLHRGIIKIKSE